jgi:hypothetical protein
MAFARKQIHLWALVAFLAGLGAGVGFTIGQQHGAAAALAAQAH